MMTQAESRPTPNEALPTETRRFNFSAVVRRLRLLDVANGGRANNSIDDQLRVRTSASNLHPATEVDSVVTNDADGMPELTINHPSLLGTMGKLPPMYNRLARETSREQDARLQAFLDVFQHPLATLFVAAKDQTNPALDRECLSVARRMGRSEGIRHDHYSQKMLNMIGLGDFQRNGTLELDPDVFVRHAGLFFASQPTVEGLKIILSDYFDEQVETCDCEITRERSRWENPGRDIGGRKFATKVADTMGRTTAVAALSGIRISIGPLSFDRFREFVPPGGPALKPLVQLTRIYLGEGYTFDIRLVLRREQVPNCFPANQGSGGSMLNRCCWLKDGHNSPPKNVEAIVSAHECRQLERDSVSAPERESRRSKLAASSESVSADALPVLAPLND